MQKRRTRHLLKIIAQIICAIGFAALNSSAFAKVSFGEITGSIPRSSAGYFDVTLNLSGISKVAAAGERYGQRIEVYIQEVSKNKAIPFSGKTSTTPAADVMSFQIEFPESDVATKGTDNLYTVKIVMRFSSNELATLMKDKTQLKIDFKYKGSGDEGDVEKLDVQIDREKGVANEAPAGVELTGSFLSVVASFTAKSTILFTDDKKKSSSGVYFYVVQRNQGDIEVSGIIHDVTAETDTKITTCKINTDADDDSECVTCDDENGYFDRTKIPETVFNASTSKGNEVSISNLKDEDASGNKIEYLGFLVFQPDGIKFSNCRVGGPIRNYTWSEMVDPDNEPSLKNPQCFIATATFGSPLHRHVETFRRFRNSYLLPHWWGRVLVDFYYFVSPPLASLVEHSETLKSWSRSLLQPIAESLEEQEASKKSP